MNQRENTEIILSLTEMLSSLNEVLRRNILFIKMNNVHFTIFYLLENNRILGKENLNYPN